MRKTPLLAVLCAAIFGLAGGAAAQAPLKIGILTELSGPLGPPGMGLRDGFQLYLKKSGG